MPRLLSTTLGKTLASALSAAALLAPAAASAYVVINLNTGPRLEVDYGADASLDLDLDQGTSSGSVDAGASATVDAGANASAAAPSVKLERAALGSTTAAVISPKAVSTNEDLQAYALGALHSDEKVERMEFTEEAVEVRYKEEGRFLALIPVDMTVTVIASADGSVEVDYPWYSVMTVDKQDTLEAELKVAVDNALRAKTLGVVRGAGEVEKRFTASEAAEVAAQIHAVLEGGLEARDED